MFQWQRVSRGYGAGKLGDWRTPCTRSEVSGLVTASSSGGGGRVEVQAWRRKMIEINKCLSEDRVNRDDRGHRCNHTHRIKFVMPVAVSQDTRFRPNDVPNRQLHHDSLHICHVTSD